MKQASNSSKEVDDYLASVRPDFRELLEGLRKTIRSVAPDAKEVISYKMPAFRYHGMLVYYAAFGDHCSLFLASRRVYRQFADQLKPFASGKGTLRFTPDHPIPTALLKRIVEARAKENESRRKP